VTLLFSCGFQAHPKKETHIQMYVRASVSGNFSFLAATLH